MECATTPVVSAAGRKESKDQKGAVETQWEEEEREEYGGRGQRTGMKGERGWEMENQTRRTRQPERKGNGEMGWTHWW